MGTLVLFCHIHLLVEILAVYQRVQQKQDGGTKTTRVFEHEKGEF